MAYPALAVNIKDVLHKIRKQDKGPSLPRVQEGPLLAEAYYETALEHLVAGFSELKKDANSGVIKIHFQNAIKHAEKCAEQNHEKASPIIFLATRYQQMLDDSNPNRNIPCQFSDAMWHFFQAVVLKHKFLEQIETAPQEMLREAEYHLKEALEFFMSLYISGYRRCFYETLLAYTTLKNIQTIKAEKLPNFWPCEGMQNLDDALTEMKAIENARP